MSQTKFRSLRFRLLLPMLVSSLISAILVAITSAWLGAQWAKENVAQQFDRIEHAISTSSFPLTENVLNLLSELTHSELITYQESGEIADSTLLLDRDAKLQLEKEFSQELASHHSNFTIANGDRLYIGYRFDRQNRSSRTDSGRRIVVLIDQAQIRTIRWRAAMLPLATGMSTVLLLGTISLYLTHRLIRRLKSLQTRVGMVASGNFDPLDQDLVQDEIGLLSTAVHSMAEQLKVLWKAIQRQQSEKLLHQISGGMAHQLRNTLTGARMALELHTRHEQHRGNEEVAVALREIQRAEDYIRRLLLVALGQQDRDKRSNVFECLHDVQSSLTPAAEHHKVKMDWDLDPTLRDCEVKDGPTLSAAVNNLVFNAMQAGSHVSVKLERVDATSVCISVADNGPGIPESIAMQIFEPFVTSKPEGMGLGLPMVRRAAEHLEGKVEWIREQDRTVFRFVVKCIEGSGT